MIKNESGCKETLNSLPLGILIKKKKEEDILFINNQFREIINFEKDFTLADLENIIFNYSAKSIYHDFETFIKNKKKSILISQFPISTDQIILIIQDYSKYQKLENELKKVSKEAKQLVQIKTDFFASMSHELRTPLHFILGTIGFLLKKDLIKKNYEIKVSLEMIKQSGQRLLEIVNQILDISKLESKKEEIEPEIFILEELVFGLKDMMKTLIGPKSIKFHLNCELNLQKSILADKRKLNQIIINLLSNSVKFTEEGVINLNIYCLKDRLYFEVNDTGFGIPSEKLDLIFEPFEQAKSKSVLTQKGTGLGLAISKQYVELMGGEIWVESEVGEGSSFIFWIPYIEKKLNKIDEDKEKSSKGINLKGFIDKRILICDDDSFNLTYLEMILKDKINYDLVESGENLLEKAKKEKYDLILIDIQMPKMDGIETLKRLKKLKIDQKTKIVALTAQAMAGDKEKFLEEGFDSYLSKPFNEESFFSFIREIITR